MDIAQILQLGIAGVSLAILYKLWQSFEKQNEYIQTLLTRFVDDRLEAQEERRAIAHAVNADVPPKRSIGA